jgi:ubiquinone/menaquinone biosynthesis C-methylase UbiE
MNYKVVSIVKKFFKIFLRKVKRFFDWLVGDYSDELYWKYVRLLRKDLKNICSNEEQIHRKFLINLILKKKNIKKILELGCGDAVNLKMIAKKNQFIDLYGIDINKTVIKRAISVINKFNFNIKLICGNMKNLEKYKNNEFDLVFTDAALMYVDSSNIYKILNEIFRVSRSKVFICEQHTDGTHFYNDKWVHNYKEIIHRISKNNLIRIYKIKDNRAGDWEKFGKIIEVSKLN